AAFPARALGQTVTVTRTDDDSTATFHWKIDGVSSDGKKLHLVAQSGQTIEAGDSYSFDLPGGINYLDSGSVTSAGSNFIVDSTRAGTPGSPWFKSGYYDIGYTLRIYHENGDGTQTLFTFLINATERASGKLIFDAVDGATISSGDRWEVYWPKY